MEEEDFDDRKLSKTVSLEDIKLATKVGASRELYEETGIDIRSDLDRLEYAIVNFEYNDNMIEDRYYFYLFVTDKDFLVPVSLFPDCSHIFDTKLITNTGP